MIEHVPVLPVRVTVVTATLQIEPEFEVNVTTNPELALAEIVNGRSVASLADRAPKVIVCDDEELDTFNATALELLAEKAPVPVKAAVKLWLPVKMLVTTKVAIPPDTVWAPLMAVPLSEKITDPVAADGATVAVSVTIWPTVTPADGLALREVAVAVPELIPLRAII